MSPSSSEIRSSDDAPGLPKNAAAAEVFWLGVKVAERAKLASVDCGCFWLNGGSGNFATTLFHGLGVAANLTGERQLHFRRHCRGSSSCTLSRTSGELMLPANLCIASISPP
jgi:hypothetical protein